MNTGNLPGVGKNVGGTTYVHISALPKLEPEILEVVAAGAQLANVRANEHFNVVKLSGTGRLSLLEYPDFFDTAFPELRRSWAVDLNQRSVRERDYGEHTNRHILHRKELLLSQDHPKWPEFSVLTEMAEHYGLFEDPLRIGYKQQWESLLEEKRLEIVGHTISLVGETFNIERHRTALTRVRFSRPFQLLQKLGYLEGYTVFDFGCGKGGDVELAQELGVKAQGWDPHFSPKSEKVKADVVNLGYVINVIEDPEHRRETLLEAAEYANKLLIVSAMLESQQRSNGVRFGDGVITKRNTFQKYFTQPELRHFIETAVASKAFALQPGIFAVFFDEGEEQKYLESLSRRRKGKPSIARVRQQQLEQLFDEHEQQLSNLWDVCVEYGRLPKEKELFEFEGLFRSIGSYRKALQVIRNKHDLSELEPRKASRKSDLLVYYALSAFRRDRRYRKQPLRLATDTKEYLGSRTNAEKLAAHLLINLADVDQIRRACMTAIEKDLGCLEDERSFSFLSETLGELPPLLRVYVGAGLELYGNEAEYTLAKIHIDTGKLTLMTCDDFWGSPLPRMLSRIKISLKEQSVEVFEYEGAFEPPYVYEKSRWMPKISPRYLDQVLFDEEMRVLGVSEFGKYGPTPDQLYQLLDRQNLTIDESQVRVADVTPKLDAPCGRYFRFRDFIECGETQRFTGIKNLPENPESYQAIGQLARLVVDPVVDYFGPIVLTYGFCSQTLEKEIPGRIAPRLDQHAAHEKRRNGRYVCSRLGSACDFLVEDEGMLEVAQWIVLNTRFDRLYFYGDSLPIHVSVGPEQKQQIVIMKKKKDATHGHRLFPVTISKSRFVEFTAQAVTQAYG